MEILTYKLKSVEENKGERVPHLQSIFHDKSSFPKILPSLNAFLISFSITLNSSTHVPCIRLLVRLTVVSPGILE